MNKMYDFCFIPSTTAACGIRKLRETKEYHVQRFPLEALCFLDGKVYSLELPRGKMHLCVYNIIPESTNLTLLDSVALNGSYCHLHADSYSRSVYVPRVNGGVGIFCLKDDRLVNVRTLMCVPNTRGVAVSSRDIAFMCDADTKSVCKVSVSTDRVTRRLQAPDPVTSEGFVPTDVAVLGETALVSYFRGNEHRHPRFVMFHTDDSPTPGHVLEVPAGNGELSNIKTDGHSSFLLSWGGFVHVLGERGNLRHKIHTYKLGRISDCAIINSQLWVGFFGGSIAVMSSE